ncbi:MAG: hypothetical protein HY288_18990 [Planctomycetia bacterium]|nr:hypothetical protein [Planctomycetia bacterium]
MSAPLEGLEKLSEALRPPVQHYATRLQELVGDRVLALTVYAAAAAGTFDRQRHTVRSAVVFGGNDLNTLRRLALEGSSLGKHRIAAPLVFTPAFLKDSCDTFPLELIEIQQQHVTIFGQDYFAQLTFADPDIRLQCERELKVIQIGMHQGLLASGGHERTLVKIGHELTEHLVRTLRGVLWLKGQRDGRPAAQVVQEIEKLLERSLPGVWGALGQSDGTPWQHFSNLYADVQALGQFVDAI